jgi:hypothetical protein
VKRKRDEKRITLDVCAYMLCACAFFFVWERDCT